MCGARSSPVPGGRGVSPAGAIKAGALGELWHARGWEKPAVVSGSIELHGTEPDRAARRDPAECGSGQSGTEVYGAERKRVERNGARRNEARRSGTEPNGVKRYVTWRARAERNAKKNTVGRVRIYVNERKSVMELRVWDDHGTECCSEQGGTGIK